jgi:DNA (cytosine-5)-methyltransferase 1
VAAVEYDPIHAAAHAFNFPLTEVVCSDANAMTGDDLRAAVEEGIASHGRAGWDGEVAAVFGGPPCQGFSSGGKRVVGDERNLLLFDFVRLATALSSRYVVMENVPPLKTYADPDHAGTLMLERMIGELDAAGYAALDPVIVNASRYGVPQDRRRLILIAARDGEAKPDYPAPTVRPVRKRERDEPRPWECGGQDEDTALPVGPSVTDAIGDLPDLDAFAELWHTDEVRLTDDAVAAMKVEASAYAKRMRRREAKDFSHPRKWERDWLTASMRTAHTLKTIERFSKTNPGDSEATSRYYRLDPNGLCSTLRAGTGYERGSFMAPRPIHPSRDRVISVREAARLHSFPDWFRFHTTKWHGFRQIGNALPPLLGRAIGAELVTAMGIELGKPQRATELGDPELLTLGTGDAAKKLGANLDRAPSHRLRHGNKRTKKLAA